MTTTEIANRLVELCRTGDFETAQKELYGEAIVSIEPEASKAFAKETRGLAAIIEKGYLFESMTETMHSMSVSDALVADNCFAVTMQMDITMKGMPRMKMTELCVYKVKDGKVVSEEFFM